MPKRRKFATNTLQGLVGLNNRTGHRSDVLLKKLLSPNAPAESIPPVNERQGSAEKDGRQVAAFLKKPLSLNLPVGRSRGVHRTAPRLKQRLSLNVPVGAGLDVES